MATKDALLAFLEQRRGSYFSGEALAEQLAVSRAAVWKSVQALRRAGYPIDAVPNRGYRLAEGADILSVPGLQACLAPVCRRLRPELWDSLPSTNGRARELAAAGAPEGTVVLARGQTEGRGRQGRGFFSPPDTGLYLSLLLRPGRCTAARATGLTTLAAVAACEAVEEICGVRAGIKWVNDLYVNGRKVGGILTEASLSLESGLVESVVVGIGLNLLPPVGGVPPELADLAGPVAEAPPDNLKNRLAAAFLNRFMAGYTRPEPEALLDAYRKRCFVVGRRVLVLGPAGGRPADVLGIDEKFRLLVEYENGERDCLFAGEISIRCPPGPERKQEPGAGSPAGPQEVPQ